MSNSEEKTARAFGGCLCGAVKFIIYNQLRDVVNCHCSKCRSFNGHAAAYASTVRENLDFIEDRGLKWYRSVQDETSNVYRGFCQECGCSLFWDPRDQENIAIAAGSLEQPTGLKTIRHVWIGQMGDYYQISDTLPTFKKGYSQTNVRDDS